LQKDGEAIEKNDLLSGVVTAAIDGQWRS